MKNLLLTLSFLGGIALSGIAQNFTINTAAGNGTYGYSGDGGQATAAELSHVQGVFADGSGDLYIADQANNAIRMVDVTGKITTVAGNGSPGYTGDGAQATAAELNGPVGVCKDSKGNLYISDLNNQVVRVVGTNGVIRTFAGNGSVGYAGDGGQATDAELNNMSGISADTTGNIYIADYGNSRIRKVNSGDTITTIAGNGIAGFAGDGAAATAAELNYPNGVTADGAGDLYIADSENNRVRKVNSGGIITTIAGNGFGGYAGDGGNATAAELFFPAAIYTDGNGNVYIADANNQCIRMVDMSGKISIVAGDTTAGYSGDGGPATAAELNSPYGLSGYAGSLYVGDFNNKRVRVMKNVAGLAPVGKGINCTLYPNPSTGIYYLQTNLAPGGVIQIFNMAGQMIRNQQFMARSQPAIDLSNEQHGAYIYRILDNGGNDLIQGKLILLPNQ